MRGRSFAGCLSATAAASEAALRSAAGSKIDQINQIFTCKAGFAEDFSCGRVNRATRRDDPSAGCDWRILQTRRTPMFRKLILALGAAVTLGAAAMAPTSASAWGFHG